MRALQGRLGVPRHTAEEAAQFAWLQLCTHDVTRDNVMGWLYTVARREVFRLHRRDRREQPTEELPEAVREPEFEEQIERRELAELLATAVAEDLTANQRAALALWAQGYSYKAAAAELGQSYTWVNRHVREGIERLRRRFGRP